MLLIALLVLETILVSGYPEFRQKIPNGENVPNPCVQNETWAGVGHLIPEGTGPRNPFGLDFFANNMVWTKALCQKDSDGDGSSNGLELGDPNCTWTIGDVVSRTTGLSHPGICEPITSHSCMEQNSWLKCQNNFSCPAFALPDTKSFNVTLPRTAIPQNETTYICMGFKLPNETKYHLIGQLPVIENRNMLHHMLLYGCTQPLSESFMTDPRQCSMGLPNCQTILALWGPGIPGTCHPDEFGFPIGLSGYQYAVMQLHWNNPSHLPDQFDSSGMTLFYTSDLRPNDGMVLMAGQTYITIPPQQSSVTVEGSCTKECSDLIKPRAINISAAILHMHLLGKSGKIELIKEGQQPMVLVEEIAYDYNTPLQFNFDTPIEFDAGDEIKVTCEYQSLNKTTTTNFGEGTQDEMCFGFITIYPAVVGFDTCSQWKDLPTCSINTYVTYSGCDLGTFSILMDAISKVCDGTCSKACKVLINGFRATGCWDSEVGEFIKLMWPIYIDANLTGIFYKIDNCSDVISEPSAASNFTVKPQDKYTDLTTQAIQVTKEVTTTGSTSKPDVSQKPICQQPPGQLNTASLLNPVWQSHVSIFVAAVFFVLRT